MILKQKINDIIKKRKPDDKLLNQVSKMKRKMINQKSFDSNTYNRLSDIEHSLYRYNNFIKNNLNKEAGAEAQKLMNIAENLDSQPTILYGGISNNQYVWHTEANACKTCQALDGKVYDNEEDIPEKPHPNCKCHIEVIEDTKAIQEQQDKKKEEPCNCIDELDIIIDELENILNDANTLETIIETEMNEIENSSTKVNTIINELEEAIEILSEEYGKHLPDCENNIDYTYSEIFATKAELQTLLNDILGLLNPLASILNVVRIFVSNYIALLYEAYALNQAGMDKYRHSKANCEAAQQSGILGSKTATALSDLKEYYDQYTYVHTHKVTIEEAIADSERDQVANRLGRERGRKYPYCSCSILMNDLKPKKF